MIYIVCALKPEAQAFVDKYKLIKHKLAKYKTFTNSSITLIVSGLGVESAREATQTLINHFDITDDDIYLNIGICGATHEYEIGELINISSIIYENISYTLADSIGRTIHCLNSQATTDKYEIVDMESYGFYDAVTHSPAIKNSYILKVVSDHFQPRLVTKEKTKMLIFNAIDDINSILFNKEIS
jgi:purine-nucleoside phosphorylase